MIHLPAKGSQTVSNRYLAISELPGKSNRRNSFPRVVNENRRDGGKSREMYSTKIRVPWIVKDGTGWKLGLAEFEPSETYPITGVSTAKGRAREVRERFGLANECLCKASVLPRKRVEFTPNRAEGETQTPAITCQPSPTRHTP